MLFITQPLYSMDMQLSKTLESDNKILQPQCNVSTLQQLCIKKIPEVIEKYLKQKSRNRIIKWENKRTKEKIKTFVQDIPVNFISEIIKYNQINPELIGCYSLRAVNANHTRFFIQEEKSILMKDEKDTLISVLPTENHGFTIALSPNERYMAVTCGECVKVYDITSNKFIEIKSHKGNFESSSFLNDIELIIAGYHVIQKWKFLENEEPDNFITAMVYGMNKICSVNNKVAFINDFNEQDITIANDLGVIEKKLKGHAGSIHYLSFNPVTQYLASAADDDTVRIWDIKKNKKNACKAVLKHTCDFDSMCFNPSGRKIVTGTNRYDHTVYVWDIDSQAIIMKHVFKDDFPITFISWVDKSVIAQDGHGFVYRWKSDSIDLNNLLTAIAEESKKEEKKKITHE